MTRITTFQAAGILVAALMCFSEVCYADNKTTTGPSTTTDVTTAEPTTTVVTAAGPTTATASNMTTTTSNMTTTGPTTTTASNMTTAFSNMTTTASNMTTAVSNMTTTGPTITTASNMTTAFSNMTTTASNMTTAVSNMTTESGTTSTTQSVTSGGTTPAQESRWKVKDKDGKLCMLMEFDGTITEVINGVTEQIPSYASTSASDCSLSSYSAFVLDFNTISSYWGIVMNFTTRGGSFKLHKLSARITSFTTSYSSSVTGDFFNVPLGDYYTCSHFNYSIGLFQLNLTNPSLQPFVQKTEGGDNFGQPYVCRPGHSVSDSYTGIIIGVIIAVIVIIAAIVVTYCLVKRRRKPSPPSYIRA